MKETAMNAETKEAMEKVFFLVYVLVVLPMLLMWVLVEFVELMEWLTETRVGYVEGWDLDE